MSEPIDILVIGEKWPPRSTFIARKIVTLANKGYVIALIGMYNTNINNIKIIKIHKRSNQLLYVLMFSFIWLLEYKKLKRFYKSIKKTYKVTTLKIIYICIKNASLILLKPKVIHFEWNSSAVSYEWMFDYYYNCPKVISCRGRQINIWPHNPNKVQITEGIVRTLKKADLVHCVCNNIAEEVCKLGINREKVQVIKTGVDPEYFYPKKYSNNNEIISIIMVGALIWRKGYEYALMALTKIKDTKKNFILKIIGDGPEFDRIIFTVKDLNLENHVKIFGKLEPERVRDEMQKSDIFLLSSLSEGIANVVVEGMACGLPIVTTDCGGMREAIDDGVEGFVVPVKDPDVMSQALIRLIDDQNLRRHLGGNGRKRVKLEFDINKQADQFMGFYEKAKRISKERNKRVDASG